MATTSSHRRVHPRSAFLLIALSIILSAGCVSSFSVIRSSIKITPPIFSSKASSISYAHSDNTVAATPKSSLFSHNTAPLKLRQATNNLLFRSLRLITTLRRSTARAIAVIAFAFLTFSSNTRPAFAWGKTTEATATEVEIPSSANKRCLKCIVTVGAVAAGAATSNKLRGPSLNTSDDQSDDSLEVVAKEDKDGASQKMLKKPINSKPSRSYNTVSNAPLVKDLDAKIERLREQEMLAIKHAANNIEKAEAAKAEQLAKTAAENEKNRIEEQIAKIAEDESIRIASLEKEKEEQTRVAQEKIAAVERERLERIAQNEAQVSQSKIEKEMKHKVSEFSEPSHVDESRMLVENDAAKRKEQERMLADKYAAMGLEERAFNILVDLGMVEVHPDEFADADDDNIDPINVFL